MGNPMLGERPVASTAAAAAAATSVTRGGARRHFKRDRYTPADLDDDVALAKSSLRMPRDGNGRNTVARPAAAAAATTTTARVSNVTTETPEALADKTQVAELYAAGLLYDDDASRSSRVQQPQVSLASITHSEPTYVIRSARPRARRNSPCGAAAGLSDLDLGLNLSFSDLGDEESVVQYLMALTAAEADATAAHGGGGSSTLSSPTLRAIQEMEADDASSEAWVVLDDEDAPR